MEAIGDCCEGKNRSHWYHHPGLFTGHDPTRGSGQEVLEMSRVGSGRVQKFSNLTRRVGSGQKVFKSPGPGPGGS